MSVKLLVETVDFVELGLCLTVLALMWKRRTMADFKLLTALLASRAICGSISIALLFFRKEVGISRLWAARIYVGTYWTSFVLQMILIVGIIYAVYSLALEPFPPLKRLGNIIFRWVAAISAIVSLSVSVGPHMFSQVFVINLIGHVQQTSNVLAICLLVFVCFALRPLGLDYRSRAFGISAGVGILATTQLVQSSWFGSSGTGIYSLFNFYSGLGFCTGVLVWAAYFSFPEPERRMVLLPTTSPYFFWNKISEALGDEPGFVAIAGFSPESLAPAELEAMSAFTHRPATPAKVMPAFQPLSAVR